MPKIGPSRLLIIAAFVVLVLSQDMITMSGPSAATSTPGDLANPQQPWGGLTSVYTRDYQVNDKGDGKNTYSTVGALGNNQLTQRLEATDFKFDLSTFGSVAGIYVEYSRRAAGTVYDYSIELLVNGQPIAGTNRCNFTDSVCAGTVWKAGDRWGTQGYGSPTDLWGLSGILKSTVGDPTFGVGIRCLASDGNFFTPVRDPDVDYVNITVYGSAVTESELGLTSSGADGANINGVVVPAVIAVIVVLLVIGGLVAIVVLVKRRPDLFQRLKKISDDRDAKAEARRQKEAAADPFHVSSSTLSLQVIGDTPSSPPSPSPSARSLPPPSHMTSSSSSPSPFIPGKSSSTPSVANYAKVVKPSGSSSQCFGVDIDVVRKIGKIPVVVEECIAWLESRGLNEEGLLRLAGSTSDVSHLKDTYNEGKSPDFKKTNDINNIAGLLKLFFRELPQKPLLMTSGIKKFAQSSMDPSEGISIMRTELESLPVTNRETLKRLFLFLHRLSQNSAINKMSPENLAIVFSPTLGLSMPLLAFMVGHADEIFV